MKALDYLRGPRGDKIFGLASIGGVSFARMLFAVLVARLTDPWTFAVYILLITVEIVAQTVMGSMLVTPLSTLGPGLPAERLPGFLGYAIRRMVRFSMGAGLLIVTSLPLAMYYGLRPEMYLGFAAYLVMWLMSRGLQGAMSCLFKRSVAFVGDVIRLGLPLAGLGLAYAWDLPVLTTFWWVAAIGNLLAVGVMLRAVERTDGIDPETKEEFHNRGFHYLTGSIANSVCTRVQPFILGMTGNPLAVALYGAANTLTGPVRILGGALGDILQPRLARHWGPAGDAEHARRALVCASLAQGVAVVGMLGTTLIAGEWIVTTVFGDRYVALAEVLPWAVGFVAVASSVAIVVVVMQVQSVQAAAYASRLRMYVGVLSLGLVWPACAWDGARGAFIAMLIAELVYFGAALLSLRSSARLPVSAPAT